LPEEGHLRCLGRFVHRMSALSTKAVMHRHIGAAFAAHDGGWH
jgi:hypothetical protein